MTKVGVDNIIIKEDKILLIQRSPNSKKFPLCWGFIGGWMEDGELPQDSLKREALEEIGVETTNFRFIGKFYSNIQSDGVTTRVVLPHLADLAEEKEFKIQKEEIAQVRWFSFEEALKLDWAYEHKEVFQYVLKNCI